MRRSTRWLGAALAGLLAAGALVGCGGDDEAETSGGAATGETKVTKIRWGQAVYSGAYWGIYAGQRQGFFEEEGIDLGISIVPARPVSWPPRRVAPWTCSARPAMRRWPPSRAAPTSS